MEKNNSKIVAIVALVVAVVALSVGFATYSQTLTINSSAVIEPTNTFSENVKYRASSASCTTNGSATVNTTNMSLTDTAWSGVVSTLKAPGDYVECTATVENLSTYLAYLKEINTASAITCTANAAGTNTNAATNAATVCSGVTLDITAGSDTAQATSSAAASNTSTSSTITAGTGTQTVTFKVTYASGTATADGDITISVPQINLRYATA